MAFKISVEPAPAASIAAVLPAFCLVMNGEREREREGGRKQLVCERDGRARCAAATAAAAHAREEHRWAFRSPGKKSA